MTTPTDSKYTLSKMIDHTAAWNWEDEHVTNSYIDDTADTVQNEIRSEDIVESGTVIICAGPANLTRAVKNTSVSSTGGIRIVPIGLIESAQISINKQLNRIFEIGSKVSYILGGRVIGGLSLNRVFFDGPSMLKVLYRGEVLEDSSTGANNKKATFASTKQGEETFKSNIGSGNIAMNLDSAFFDKPLGLAFIFRDREGNTVGQIYFEECNVSSYGMGISANMNVLSESVSIEFTKIKPIVTAASSVSGTEGKSTLSDKNIVTPSKASDRNK